MMTALPTRFWALTFGAVAFGTTLAVAPAQAQPAKPQAPAAKSGAPGRPLTDAERKSVTELQVEQKRLDTGSARTLTASPEGRRRVTETIARQFGVSERVVTELRGLKMGYGEVTTTLALAQQLMKRDRLSQQQAIDRIVAMRRAGQGWGLVARDLGLKLGDVVSEVKKADTRLSALEPVKAAQAEKVERPAKTDKPSKPEKIDKPARPEKADRGR